MSICMKDVQQISLSLLLCHASSGVRTGGIWIGCRPWVFSTPFLLLVLASDQHPVVWIVCTAQGNWSRIIGVFSPSFFSETNSLILLSLFASTGSNLVIYYFLGPRIQKAFKGGFMYGSPIYLVKKLFCMLFWFSLYIPCNRYCINLHSYISHCIFI